MKHLFYPSLVLAAFCTAGTSLGHAQQHKQLNVKKVQVSAPVEAQDVPALMDRNGVEFQPIDQVNWKEYPYKPQVAFRIAHTGKEILVHYRVTEVSVRAVAAADNGKVWEDACAEFFVSPEANDFYYNFECNCAAKLLIQAGRPGDRPMADPAVVATVKRWSSLGSEPFEERVGECTWELALVIRRRAKDVKAEDFADYILGYTCLNDVTARDVQKGDGQWTRGKSMDGFAPLGPVVTDEVDPAALDIETRLNGAVVQRGNTSQFMTAVPQLLEFITASMTLEPGDVVTTGTPAGVGPMVSGDTVEVTVQGIGTLRNHIV